MKKKLLSLLLAGAMVLSMAACGSEEAPAAAPSADAGTTATGSGDGKLTGTLNLGMIGPLTGGAAIYGSNVANAAQIAVDEVNAISPDFQISLNCQDDEHDAEKSVNAYNNLKDWNVQAIVGCVTTSPCIAVSAEANSDRVFMLTPSASGPAVIEGKDNRTIASELFLSEGTIKTHVHNIMVKTGTKTRPELKKLFWSA